MNESKTLDDFFQRAVSAIDAGDVRELEHLVTVDPRLVRERLNTPGAWLRDKLGSALDGFFERPYLLWFVAEDPVRNGRLPGNIADVTRVIIRCRGARGCRDPTGTARLRAEVGVMVVDRAGLQCTD